MSGMPIQSGFHPREIIVAGVCVLGLAVPAAASAAKPNPINGLAHAKQINGLSHGKTVRPSRQINGL